MSFRGKGRGRGRSGGGGDYSSRYSEHDNRADVSNRDYENRSSYQGKVRGDNYRGRRRRSSNNNNYRGSRGNYNYTQKNNYRSNRGRRPTYSGGPPRGRSNYSTNDRVDASPLEDDDGDVNMDGEAQHNNRPKPYDRPRPDRYQRPRPDRYQTPNPRRPPTEKAWYQITILDGSMHDEEWLREEIQNTAFVQFHPFQYHLDGQKSSFFIEDRSTAEAIRDCSKKIAGPDGSKLVILMRLSRTPPFTETQVDKIKEVLSGRFSSADQHLDASSLFHDRALNDEQIHLKIGPVNYHLFIVAKIIAENISSLVSLDLSANILGNMDALKLLVPMTPCLKKLNLEKNNIKSIKELEKLKDWNLTELTLNKNPVCGDYKSTTEYISDVRDIFPELKTLDGHTLPAPVILPKLDNSEIPKSIRDYMPANGQDIIRQFIEQYFTCYDKSRSSLTEAYHEDTVFTFSVPSSPRGPSLSKYYQLSRNLKRMKNSSLKTSSVCTRRDDILLKLEKLPSTKHLLTSFSIDVPLVTSTIVNFIVRGLFKESGRDGFLRAFSRSFFCQVANNGLKIINEQYFVRNPTSSEIKESKNPTTAASSSASIQPQSKTASASSIQRQMIEAFVKESRMNVMFSEQCLKENNWNYEEAGKMFLTLKEQGKIPPEAFK